MHWYMEVLKKYAVFEGRACRKELWIFFLVNIIIMLFFGYMERFVKGAWIAGTIFAVAVFVPNLAVSVRRLHDIGRNGWWLLIYFIPLIGAVVLIVFWVMDGQPNDNEYGPNPKTAEV